jgi:hypothetical protein
MRLLFLFLLIFTSVAAQDTLVMDTTFFADSKIFNGYSLDNSLTGVLAQSNTKNINITFIGNNSINFKKVDINSILNYSIGFSPKINQDEFSHKINISHEYKNMLYFVNNQYNYSLLRSMQNDNWFGVGLGYKKKFKHFKTSLSYGIIYQNTQYFNDSIRENIRHSIRFKLNYEKNRFGFYTEYYYQPSMVINNVIITGNTKITLKTSKHLSFMIQDVINYVSTSKVIMIHNLTIGLGYLLNKER